MSMPFQLQATLLVELNQENQELRTANESLWRRLNTKHELYIETCVFNHQLQVENKCLKEKEQKLNRMLVGVFKSAMDITSKAKALEKRGMTGGRRGSF
jgi:hypothetical protein